MRLVDAVLRSGECCKNGNCLGLLVAPVWIFSSYIGLFYVEKCKEIFVLIVSR